MVGFLAVFCSRSATYRNPNILPSGDYFFFYLTRSAKVQVQDLINELMKQILPLVCAALIALPMGVQAQAMPGREAAAVIMKVAFGDPDRKHHGGDDRDNGNGQNNRGNNGQGGNGNGRGNGGYGEQRDNRINQAIAIASSRGRVLDAGSQGGSIFWVRVATDHGRVDLLVDVDSGRIIGER